MKTDDENLYSSSNIAFMSSFILCYKSIYAGHVEFVVMKLSFMGHKFPQVVVGINLMFSLSIQKS